MEALIRFILSLMAVLTSTTGAENIKYAQVGDSANFELAQGININNKYLYWYFDDTEVAWRNPLGGTWTSPAEKWKDLSLSGHSLALKTIKLEHFGTFSYRVQLDGVTESSASYRLLKLDVSKKPASPVLPGESLSLVCNAESSNGKKPQIYWLDPQGEKIISGSPKVTVTDQSNGLWTCVVKNNEKQTEAKISVTVMNLSPAASHPQYTSKSSSLNIPCSFSPQVSWEQIKAKGILGGHWHFIPKQGSSLSSVEPQRLFSLSLEDQVTWKPEQDRGLTVSDFKTGYLSLTRRQGRADDSGDYVCTLQFKNGITLNRTVQVEFLQVVSSPGTELISGQQVNLTCLDYPLPSGLHIKWTAPSQSSFRARASGHKSPHLLIPEVGTGDSGDWKCEVRQSDKQLAVAVIKLKIKPKLSVWMLVIICSVAVIISLVLALIFILHRRRKQSMRHHRHQRYPCNPKPKGFYKT